MQSAPQRPVPLFPLPDAVLFPGVLLPLHVFELRYRTMVRDALSADRRIVMALLRPGWEGDYFGSPEIYPLACLGEFEEVEWLPNDCYNLKLRGVSRVRVGPVAREFPYRAARIQVVPQAPMSDDDPLVLSELEGLRAAYQTHPAFESIAEALKAPLEAATGYECLVNTLCTFLPMEAGEKMNLLEMDSVLDRGRRLRQVLEWTRPGGPRNPEN